MLDLFVDLKHNEDILIKDLSLCKQGRNIIYSNKNMLVLSPYISEGKYHFDISEPNIQKCKIDGKKGFLLIRFHDRYLLEEMCHIMNELIDDSSKAPYYKYSAEFRWKFKIVMDGCYHIQRIKNKKLLPIKEYSREALVKKLKIGIQK